MPILNEIAVVSPVYKSSESIREFVQKVEKHLKDISPQYEIILVNDGSPDNSWEIMRELSAANQKIKSIKLSRNFGQHPAIYCGLQHSRAYAVIVMDCDLQEDPKYIRDLYQKYKEGYDIVYTLKRQRKHTVWKNIATRFFTKIYNYLLDNKSLQNNENVGSYSLISRKVVQAFMNFKDYQFHYLIVLRWLGFRSAYIEIEHLPRKHGKSSYNFKKLFEHALVAIVFQSDKLLRLNIYLGFFISLLSFIAGIIIIINYFLHGYAHGWTSIFVLILFSLGILLFSLGIVGLYIGKMFDQTKNRPVFIVDEKINLD